MTLVAADPFDAVEPIDQEVSLLAAHFDDVLQVSLELTVREVEHATELGEVDSSQLTHRCRTLAAELGDELDECLEDPSVPAFEIRLAGEAPQLETTRLEVDMQGKARLSWKTLARELLQQNIERFAHPVLYRPVSRRP